MTKTEMVQELIRYYPNTTAAYWAKETAAVVELNHRLAVDYYGPLSALR